MTTNTILQGDCLASLRTLPDKSVHTCITSPPYYGLRDYQTATWEGGDPNCDHKGNPLATRANVNRNYNGANDVKNAEYFEPFKSVCGKCGATRIDSQIGLEETPEEYVQKLVEVFREVKRVLRDDGTLWLNLGDSYAGYWGDAKAKEEGRPSSADTNGWTNGFSMNSRPQFDSLRKSGLKPKDLIGIPWRVAFALQQDGWYLRQDIIWHKPNPMPESVTDRCTKAHEYIFLLSKSQKYYFDNEAIKEDSKNPEDDIRRITKQKESNKSAPTQERLGIRSRETTNTYEKRNRRSVWSVPTKPYSEAHFATFPQELITPCILAGAPKDGIVLDPFGGAGTTALAALQHQRQFVLCELNPDYIKIATKRIQPFLNLIKF